VARHGAQDAQHFGVAHAAILDLRADHEVALCGVSILGPEGAAEQKQRGKRC
jgi:hypothetical protein